MVGKQLPGEARGGQKPIAGYLARANVAISWLEDVGALISGVSVFTVMLIVFLDVFKRYFFRAPFTWSYDLIALYLVPVMFFLVVSETFKRNHHVAVDILYLRFSPAWKRIARLLIAILMLPIVWEMVRLSALETFSSYQSHEVLSGAILWPTWIPLAIVVLGFGLLLLRVLLDAVALAVAVSLQSADVPGESPERSHATSHDESLP